MPQVPPPKRHPYDQWSPDARALDLVGDKWTLLIVRDLAGGPRRFVELQRVLPGISTEQLRSRLNRMVADGMLTRQRYREVPPRVDYELTERSRDLLPVLGELARWGYEWAWSNPRNGERVDIGAIVRLAGGLVAGSSEHTGEVALDITDGDREGGPVSFTIRVTPDSTEVIERASSSADATVTGTTAGWTQAFCPEPKLDSVEITGNRTLAEYVLGELAQTELQRAFRERAAASGTAASADSAGGAVRAA
jgi:DNA-binding HxlR family transcriptional regulator